jgi:hypothetical protein
LAQIPPWPVFVEEHVNQLRPFEEYYKSQNAVRKVLVNAAVTEEVELVPCPTTAEV